LGMGEVRNISLFPFSSAQPTFNINIQCKNKLKNIVARGELSNKLLIKKETIAGHDIDKEIYVHHLLSNLGLNVPTIYFDSNIFNINTYSSNNIKSLKFYIMSYVEGKAVDKFLMNMNYNDKQFYLSNIAKLYSNIHSVKGEHYGTISSGGVILNHTNSFEAFLLSRKYFIYSRLEKHLNDGELSKFKLFFDNIINKLLYALECESFFPKPSLVLIDGNAGNMLMTRELINLIDFGEVGFFDPLQDLVNLYYCLRLIFNDPHEGASLWREFLNNYQLYGGLIPSNETFLIYMNVMCFIMLITSYDMYLEFSSNTKNIKAKVLMDQIKLLVYAEKNSYENIFH
jgi:hypothetical protein